MKIEFPEPKAPPSRLNIIGLGAFSGPLGIQFEHFNFGVLSPKASGLLSARVAVRTRVQGAFFTMARVFLWS